MLYNTGINFKNYNYIITGVAGKIGRQLSTHLKSGRFLGLYHDQEPIQRNQGQYLQVDLSEASSLSNIKHNDFPIVIHAAAFTHIDHCEVDRHLETNSQAWKANVEATKNLVTFCKENNKKLVFLSSECVFDGQKSSYKEDDHPNPQSWYGQTKFKAEEIIKESGLDYLIIRSVIAYGGEKTTSDIVASMYDRLYREEALRAVEDQKINPTYIQDIVDGIFALLDVNANGIFHLAGSTITSPYQLAIVLARKIGNGYEKLVTAVTREEFFGKERATLRLPHSVLNIQKYKRLTGHEPKTISKGLDAFLIGKKTT